MAKNKTAKQPIFTLTNVLVGGAVVAAATAFFIRTNRAHAALPDGVVVPPPSSLVFANQTRATGDARVGDVLQVSVMPQAPYTLFARHPDGNEAQVTCPPNVACTVTVDAPGTWVLRATTTDGAPLGTPVVVPVVPLLAIVPPPPPPAPTLTGAKQTLTPNAGWEPGTPIDVRREATGGATGVEFQTIVTKGAGVPQVVCPWSTDPVCRFTPSTADDYVVQSQARVGEAVVTSLAQTIAVRATAPVIPLLR